MEFISGKPVVPCVQFHEPRPALVIWVSISRENRKKSDTQSWVINNAWPDSILTVPKEETNCLNRMILVYRKSITFSFWIGKLGDMSALLS